MNANQCFELLWKDYTELCPDTKMIHDAFLQKETKVLNDHVAFRTFEGTFGIEHFAKPFLAMGYTEGSDYTFEQKKLYAKHYQHSDPKLPKVFISELKTHEFSSSLQNIIGTCLKQISGEQAISDNFFVSGRLWDASYATYESLLEESEYAAWLYAFGFRANHFTVNINALEHFASIEEVNTFIESLGFALNDSGGKIKGSPEDLLEQSSTKASKAVVKFTDGDFAIPSCYYEFALRYEESPGNLYQGFVAKSADKIFESTNKY